MCVCGLATQGREGREIERVCVYGCVCVCVFFHERERERKRVGVWMMYAKCGDCFQRRGGAWPVV